MERRHRCALIAVAALAVAAAPARAATIPVDTEVDGFANDGRCGLREAVSAADNDAAANGCPAGGGTDTIAVPAGLYSLNGTLILGSSTNIVGAGSVTTVISQVLEQRVMAIGPLANADVTVEAVTVTGGAAPDGTSAPFASGGNAVGQTGGSGVPGGGIANLGSSRLTVVRARITGNSAGDGGNGGGAAGGNGANDTGSACTNGGTGTGGTGGAGGSGGGIYSVGALVVRDSLVSSNFAGAGGRGGAATGGNGGNGGTGISFGCIGGAAVSGQSGVGGAGGGVAALGNVTVERSVISDNRAGAGGQGSDGTGGNGGHGATSPAGNGAFGASGRGGNGGTGGHGGGIALLGGTSTITETVFTGNRAGAGGGAGWGFGGDGGIGGSGKVGGGGGAGTGGNAAAGGHGGGIYAEDPLDLARTLIAENGAGAGGLGGRAEGGSAGGAPGGSPGPGGAATGGSGGAGGSGSGLRLEDPTTLTNSTVSGNATAGGGNGGGAFGAFSGGGSGFATAGAGGAAGVGGIDAMDAATLRGLTVAANSPGTPGQPGTNSSPGASNSAGAAGVGAVRGTGAATIEDSIVAGNTPATCGGPIVNGGNNIVAGQAGCPGTEGDPRLEPLADNGGPSSTHALGAGSAALDVVPAGDCSGPDQRGVSRPRGAACDAGAYERAAPDAATGPADAITGSSARLTATVNPNGRATTVRFEYGPTPALGSSTPAQASGAALGAGAVGADVTGLAPSTTYYFRVVASSADGESAGTVGSFTTSAALDAAPVITGATMRSRVPVRSRARVRFTLSEDARVTFRIRRLLPGRRVNRRCVPPRPANRTRPRCTRRKAVARSGATLTAGRRAVRLPTRALRPGRYELTINAVDAAGRRSAPVKLRFRIVRRR